MGTSTHFFLFLLLRLITVCSTDTYSVKIISEQHVNTVDSRFLSFTIDPKFLFEKNDKYSSKECVCMASSLTPAYLRIAGPSTAHMTFHNTTISINDVNFPDPTDNFDITVLDSDVPKQDAKRLQTKSLAVSHRQWKRFVQWAKTTGFDLVFALNNEERTASGMWDPNTALNILTVAEKLNVGDMFWELGYECTNQSIEEYLNDLETLRVIIETFPPGRTLEWKVVAGDVTKCIQADSKSDFKDYMILSNDMMDALLLNGNSSSRELERMSEHDRLKLLRHLAHSKTPLWLTEANHKKYNDLERAADWLASLGYSARNGFTVHYRELAEEEMYEPTLSYYMALLFKNLVGERVIDIQMDPDQAILFAHCTTLRHKPIPGAVTLYGANMDDEPARFSLKLSRREEGGDIMQFILGTDHNGNIIVNGRPMYIEGNLKPVLKRVRPYKTLLINLPAKSFGFWVLANTQIQACQSTDNENKTLTEAEMVSNEQHKTKRSVSDDIDEYTNIADISYDFDTTGILTPINNALNTRINEMNKDLNKIHNLFFQKNNSRFKREDSESSFGKGMLRKKILRFRSDRAFDRELNPKKLLEDLLQKARQKVNNLKSFRPNLRSKLNFNNKVSKRSKNSSLKSLKSLREDTQKLGKIHRKPKYIKQNLEDNDDILSKINRKKKNGKGTSKIVSETQDTTVKKSENIKSEEVPNILETVSRRRKRSTGDEIEEISADNEIELSKKEKAKLWKVLEKLNKKFGGDDEKSFDEEEEVNSDTDSTEGIVLKTEVSDDSATIKVKDSNHGMIKTTMRSMLTVLQDLNTNLNKVWNAIHLLE